MSVVFVAPRVPLVDLNTGLITREWYRLLSSLFTGAGISDGEAFLVAPVAPTDALAAQVQRLADEVAFAPLTIAPILADDLTPPITPIFMAVDDVLPTIGALRDEIAMLRREIDGLRQGTMS